MSSLALYRVDEKLATSLSAFPSLEKLSCGFGEAEVDLRGLRSLKSLETNEHVGAGTAAQPVVLLLPPAVKRIKCSYKQLPSFGSDVKPEVNDVEIAGARKR